MLNPMLTFNEVLQWILAAKLEEQLALHAVLQVNVVGPALANNQARIFQAQVPKPIQPPADFPPMSVPGPLPGMTTEMQVLDRNGNPIDPKSVGPGHYTAQITAVKGEPEPVPSRVPVRVSITYTPKSAFAKKWWKEFERGARRYSAAELAALVKQPHKATEISNTLGSLFKRNIVFRWKLSSGRGYVYAPRVVK